MRLACCSYGTSPQSGTTGGGRVCSPAKEYDNKGGLAVKEAAEGDRRRGKEGERKENERRAEDGRGKKGIGLADRLPLGSASSH